MRSLSPLRLIILSALLLVTVFLVNSHSSKRPDIFVKVPLRQVFAKIGDSDFVKDYPMDVSIVEELKLDDYLFKSYARNKGLVNLYIGYYRTAKKVGAAHDPLVCFTGKGWQVISRDSGLYTLTRYPNLQIYYSSMIAEYQGDRELVVYWFQTNAKATDTTFSQKVAVVMDKLSGKNEVNAFVRISTPIKEETPEVVRKRLLDFIDDFYPEFYRYVTKNN
jgi:EpsI family protein